MGNICCWRPVIMPLTSLAKVPQTVVGARLALMLQGILLAVVQKAFWEGFVISNQSLTIPQQVLAMGKSRPYKSQRSPTASNNKETMSYMRGFCCMSQKDCIYLSWMGKSRQNGFWTWWELWQKQGLMDLALIMGALQSKQQRNLLWMVVYIL